MEDLDSTMAFKACLAFPHNGMAKMPWVLACFELFNYEFMFKKEEDRRLDAWSEWGSCNIPLNRNVIVHKYLEGTTAQYLWFVDTDTQFEPKALEGMCSKMEELDADILACPYFIGDGGISFYTRSDLGMYDQLKTLKHDEVYDLDAAGTGMMLIHRRVLVKMEQEYGNLKHWQEGTVIPAAWFGYDPDGEMLGSDDMTFCQRAQDIGFKLKGWAEYIPNHWKDQPVRPNLKVGE